MMSFFFFNDTATTEIYTLSLHDALPICVTVATTYLGAHAVPPGGDRRAYLRMVCDDAIPRVAAERLADAVDAFHETIRSEEHTSELQSRQYLVCRLLLEKKKIGTASVPM